MACRWGQLNRNCSSRWPLIVLGCWALNVGCWMFKIIRPCPIFTRSRVPPGSKWAAFAGARRGHPTVHGRGSSPHDIAGLADVMPGAGIAFLAPSATGGTWYPQRFLAPLERNEPWLSSALTVIDQLVAEVLAAGIAAEQIGLAGFSQGACLVLEYAVRNPRRYGFVAGLSGALIGPPDTPRPTGDLHGTPRPASNLHGTPVLLGCAELDTHIPLDYVERSAEILSPTQGGCHKADFSRRRPRWFFPRKSTGSSNIRCCNSSKFEVGAAASVQPWRSFSLESKFKTGSQHVPSEALEPFRLRLPQSRLN